MKVHLKRGLLEGRQTEPKVSSALQFHIEMMQPCQAEKKIKSSNKQKNNKRGGKMKNGVWRVLLVPLALSYAVESRLGGRRQLQIQVNEQVLNF